jgi:hypothetical protein
MSNKLAGGLAMLTVLLFSTPHSIPQVPTNTYTVTNTNDSGVNSLRWAIDSANSHPGSDSIQFNIPTSDPHYDSTHGDWLIYLASQLPTLSDGGTVIDGYSQMINQGDTNLFGPEIALVGYPLAIDSDNNVVQGLTISGAAASGPGIRIITEAANNLVQGNNIGTDPWGQLDWGNESGIEITSGAHDNIIEQNVISGNDGNGVLITGANTDSNQVRQNYIGLNASGTAAIPNQGHGVWITNDAEDNMIGGDSETYRNVISGNEMNGVEISGGAYINWVRYNYIGTTAAGAGSPDVGNLYSGINVSDGAVGTQIWNNVISGNHQHGIYISGYTTHDTDIMVNIVGANPDVSVLIPNHHHGIAIYDGPEWTVMGNDYNPGLRNVVVGNGWSGIAAVNSDKTCIYYNSIGTDAAGTATDLGNKYYGIAIDRSTDSAIKHNDIAYNGTYTLTAGIIVKGSVALHNEITQNSIHDNNGKGIELADGGNAGIGSPVIMTASCTHVEGPACAGCRVDIYSDGSDEGRVYEGWANATPDFSWNGNLDGPNVTVTATDGDKNTSEFSLPYIGACYKIFLPVVMR